ncbi:asparaginase [Pseudonocardia humida]|uniref:Asparaginase n=1 Tax=Pseudonocardia humida TaxID=2800819 RepID=A0ABT0ZX27_9PSEU|nr:asparaginase [Pseudonocardia humida]MCO1655300.1 asparaginase [Pseudonocardia humida]
MTVAPLAHVTRSGFLECVHHGAAVALDASGSAAVRVGDPSAVVLPRSSLKPVQLLAMLRAGVDLPGPQLALAAASHSGEPFHVEGVAAILRAAGLSEQDLRNTPDLPIEPGERLRWQCAGRAAVPMAQNCSGKHAAMLATCAANDWPLDSYLDPAHPLQRLVRETIAELTGEPVDVVAVDGCGAPAFGTTLDGLARAFATLARAEPGTPEARVAAAIREHPEYLGGTGRDVTALIRAVQGLIAKDGAEGVYAAALPDGRAAALKIADGAARARQPVMVALLRRLGVEEIADDLAHVAVLGHGEPVGEVTAAPFDRPDP